MGSAVTRPALLGNPRARWSWVLVHPVFWVSVVVLVVNDRVLKWSFPGVVTGKLSDVAGVVMVGLVLVALSGRVRVSLVVTGVLFSLLKTVPVVAVWAVPVLGGRTLTDPTDVVAVVVLVPLGWWLWSRGRDHGRGHVVARPGSAVAAWGTVAKIAGVFVAVLATSATSCSGNSFEALTVTSDGTIVAGGADEYASPERLVLPVESNETTDGGDFLAWESDDDLPDVDLASGETRACTDDGVCVDIRGLTIVEVAPGGEETLVLDYSDKRDALNAQDGPCGSELKYFPDVVSNGDVVVVAMGRLGAMVRTSEGDWLPTGSSGYYPSNVRAAARNETLGRAVFLMPLAAALIGIIFLLAYPTRARARATGIVLALVALVGTLVALLMWAAFWGIGAPSTIGLSAIASLSITVGCIIFAVAGRARPDQPLRPPPYY